MIFRGTIHGISFIRPQADGHLHFSGVTNNAPVNVHGQGLVWTYSFSSLGRIPRSGIAGPNSNSVFNLLRVSRAAVPFHFRSGAMGVPMSPDHHWLPLPVLLMTAILADMEWFSLWFLVCVSLMADDADYHVLCGRWDTSLQKYLQIVGAFQLGYLSFHH